MIEFVGRIEDGMPELETQAHAWLPGPRSPAVIYTHRLTIALMDDSGDVSDSNAVLTRARELGWVETSDYAGWEAPCPGWEATLNGEHFLVRQPDGGAWYDGTLPVDDVWRAAARAAGQVFHFTAATLDVRTITEQVASGQALVVVSTLT